MLIWCKLHHPYQQPNTHTLKHFIDFRWHWNPISSTNTYVNKTQAPDYTPLFIILLQMQNSIQMIIIHISWHDAIKKSTHDTSWCYKCVIYVQKGKINPNNCSDILVWCRYRLRVKILYIKSYFFAIIFKHLHSYTNVNVNISQKNHDI